jgi:hypothetical protein
MTAVQEVAAEAAASEAASKAYDTRTPDSLAKAAVTTDLTNWGIPMPSKQRTYKEKLQDDIRNIEILGNAPTEGNSLADVKEKLSILQENKGEGPAGGQFYSASQARGFSQVSSEEQKAIDIENQLRNNPAKYGIPKAAIKSTGEPSYNAVQNRTRTDIIKEKLEKTKRNNARSIEPEIDQSRIPFTQEELTRLESNGKRGGDAPELTSGGVPYSVIKKRGEEHTQRLLMGSGGLSKAEQEAALNAPTGAQVADQRMELERKRIEEEKEKFKPSTPQYDMYFARGGFVSPSYYAKGGDVVPAMLTPGEFVMNKRAVDNHGSLIRKLNAGGSVQGFASGGLVGGKTAYLEHGGGTGDASMPSFDFSALTDSMKTFNSVFDSSISRLIEGFPAKIEVTLASEGINVHLNSSEFLAKIPDIMKSVIMNEMIGTITELVKTNLASGR